MGEEFYHNYKTAVYLAGSASAEFFADIGLCPFEAVKVIYRNLCCASQPLHNPDTLPVRFTTIARHRQIAMA